MEKIEQEISANKRSVQKILSKKFAKCELDDATRDPEYWINDTKLFRGPELRVIIDDVLIITHIMSNLHESCENIFKNLKNK